MGVPTGAGRRPARERAFSLLYEATQRDLTAREILAQEVVAPDPYTVAVVEGVLEARDDLDARIRATSRNWPLERMPLVDLTLLRLGAWELECRPDVPAAVVLNEAVELANTYSTDESGRFVNGVLSSLAKELRPEESTG